MLPCASLSTLKCWTPSPHLTESEKSPGELSETRTTNAPSCCKKIIEIKYIGMLFEKKIKMKKKLENYQASIVSQV